MDSDHGHTYGSVHAPARTSTRTPTNGVNGNATASFNSAFTRFPTRVIERILQLADVQTFSSLAILNRTWHATSKNEDLYANHLLQCPAVSSGGRATYDTLRHQGLDEMRRLMARESRQDLWNSYSYQETTFRLVAPSTSTSTALPRGDVLKFKFSSSRKLMLAVSSSRIFVIDTRSYIPTVLRELMVRRRPFAADISGDGLVLALLTASRRLNIYRFGEQQPHHGQSIQLQSPAKAIALAPDSTVLAAAGDAGIEIVPLRRVPGNQLRSRVVRSQPMDYLTFSADGMVLIGTQTKLDDPITIAIHTSPRNVFEAEEAYDEALDQLWITQPLFPNTFRQCGYAVPLPNAEFEDTDKAFAFDAPADAFGTLDLRALRFTSSTESRGPLLRPSKSKGWTSPAINDSGDLIAIADSRLRLHIVALADQCRIRQVMLDEALYSVCWIAGSQHHVQRLVGVLPPEKTQSPGSQQYETFPVDVGRLAAFDFGSPLEDGELEEVTIHLETGNPETIDDSTWGFETDLQLQTSSTYDPRAGSPTAARSAPPPLGRSVTQARRTSRTWPIQRSNPSNASQASESGESTGRGGLTLEDAQFTYEDFTPAGPRNRTTLQRAATAASTNRRPRHEPEHAQQVIRHQSGRWEVPDESDADNWVPPPPPYFTQPTVPAQPFHPPNSFVTPPPPDVPRLQRSLTDSAVSTRSSEASPADAAPPVPPMPISTMRSPGPILQPAVPLLPSSMPQPNQPALRPYQFAAVAHQPIQPALNQPALQPYQFGPVAPQSFPPQVPAQGSRGLGPGVLGTANNFTPQAWPIAEETRDDPTAQSVSPQDEEEPPRPSISNASAASPSTDLSRNSESSSSAPWAEAAQSLPSSGAASQRSSVEPQRTPMAEFDPGNLLPANPAISAEQQEGLYGSSRGPQAPPLETSFEDAQPSRHIALPQSPQILQQETQSPRDSNRSDSPSSPPTTSIMSERKRNTLLRRNQSPTQQSQKRHSMAPMISPSNPLPKSRPLSEIAIQVPRSSSASHAGGNYAQNTSPHQVAAGNFVPPSEDLIARLNRRYTLRAEEESPSSVPSAAAGARRSLVPEPHEDLGQPNSHRVSRTISISSLTAGGQEEHSQSNYPADRRYNATLASIASNTSAFHSEPVLVPSDPTRTGHEPGAESPVNGNYQQPRRNFTSPLASTSAGATGPPAAPSSHWNKRQNRWSISDRRSYRAWTEQAASNRGSIESGSPVLPGDGSQAWQGSGPAGTMEENYHEPQSHHVVSAPSHVWLPPPVPVQPQQPPTTATPKGSSGAGLGRFKTVLGRGDGTSKKSTKQIAEPVKKEKGGRKCIVM